MTAIQFCSHLERPITPVEMSELYDHLGWWPERTDEAISMVLGSEPGVGAWEGHVLVAFVRAVTDGAFRASIEDVAVHETRRGYGGGQHIVARLIELTAVENDISLFRDPALVPFYEGHGFRLTHHVVLHRRNASR